MLEQENANTEMKIMFMYHLVGSLSGKILSSKFEFLNGEMLMKYLPIIFLGFLVSCSHYSFERAENRNAKAITYKDFELEIIFDSNDLALNKEQLNKWLVEGINSSVNDDNK